MREILFRGKSVKTGKWIYGWYVRAPFDSWPLRACIIPADRAEAGEFIRIEVDPETVSQFTGLFDRNNTKVFEGDAIRKVDLDGKVFHGIVRYGKYHIPFYEDETNIGFCIEWVPEYFWRRDLVFWIDREDVEIVGNIYDNPELLEVK